MGNQNHSTGPKTPEGKRACSLKRRFHSSTDAYRHGLTGQLNILTPEEQQAYDKHSQINLEALAATDYERDLAQSIADDRWCLKRARTIESGMFVLGMQNNNADSTGAAQVDDALAQARTWTQAARNLQLLTIYEQRIRRAVDKSMAELKTLQTKRQEVVKEEMRQAELLYQLAQAEGKPYQPEAFFVVAPLVRESVFSTPEVARELTRDRLIRGCQKQPLRRQPPPRRTRQPKPPAPTGHRPSSSA